MFEREGRHVFEKHSRKKQFRYGNLHIREYNDKYLVHTDKVDPRKDPLGHLAIDAPEVLVGIACAVFGGSTVAKNIFKNNSKKISLSSTLVSSVLAGYLGYTASKKLKEKMG